MDTLTPDLLAALTLTSGVALAMVWLGKQKARLEERSARKRCPSCGRLVDSGCSCVCHR